MVSTAGGGKDSALTLGRSLFLSLYFRLFLTTIMLFTADDLSQVCIPAVKSAALVELFHGRPGPLIGLSAAYLRDFCRASRQREARKVKTFFLSDEKA
jgi:hypothetical protein